MSRYQKGDKVIIKSDRYTFADAVRGKIGTVTGPRENIAGHYRVAVPGQPFFFSKDDCGWTYGEDELMSAEVYENQVGKELLKEASLDDNVGLVSGRATASDN